MNPDQSCFICVHLRSSAVPTLSFCARKKKRLAPGGASRGLWGSDPGSGVNGSECAGKVGVIVATQSANAFASRAITHPSLADKPHFTMRQPITDEIEFCEARAEAVEKILHSGKSRELG
jgi:hypothetical protein